MKLISRTNLLIILAFYLMSSCETLSDAPAPHAGSLGRTKRSKNEAISGTESGSTDNEGEGYNREGHSTSSGQSENSVDDHDISHDDDQDGYESDSEDSYSDLEQSVENVKRKKAALERYVRANDGGNGVLQRLLSESTELADEVGGVFRLFAKREIALTRDLEGLRNALNEAVMSLKQSLEKENKELSHAQVEIDVKDKDGKEREVVERQRRNTNYHQGNQYKACVSLEPIREYGPDSMMSPGLHGGPGKHPNANPAVHEWIPPARPNVQQQQPLPPNRNQPPPPNMSQQPPSNMQQPQTPPPNMPQHPPPNMQHPPPNIQHTPPNMRQSSPNMQQPPPPNPPQKRPQVTPSKIPVYIQAPPAWNPPSQEGPYPMYPQPGHQAFQPVITANQVSQPVPHYSPPQPPPNSNQVDLSQVYWLRLDPKRKQEVLHRKVDDLLKEKQNEGRDVLIIPISHDYQSADEVKNGFLRAVRLKPDVLQHNQIQFRKIRSLNIVPL